MQQKKVLYFNIPAPCSENWETMEKTEAGRHCSKCNQLIYDFSQLTDDELLHFFTARPEVHCGRFHNTQLNRTVAPSVKTKRLLIHRFNKIAAAIFTILSFKAFPSAAAKEPAKKTVLDAAYKKTIATGGKVIISGTIKDDEGKPLDKATVIFDSVQVAITDTEGKFSFEIENVSSSHHNVYFKYGDLITAVRTYHPAMLSTGYEVVLYKRSEDYHTMGISMPPQLGALPSLDFKLNATKLSAGNKAMLSAIATKLKNNPFTNIEVIAYPEASGRQSAYFARIQNIKKYLIEKEGISADRITTNFEVGSGDKNTVDIKQN